MTYWLAWEEPRAVGDLVHVEKFFARNLGGLTHARTSVPGRLGKAKAARRACTRVRSRMAKASSTSMPRYLTVLSILVWPSRSWTALRFPVRR